MHVSKMGLAQRCSRWFPGEYIVWQCLLIIVASFTAELNSIPSSIFKSKKSIVNGIVVNFGWGIVLASVVGQHLVFTNIIGGIKWPQKLRKPALRLAVATVMWYTCTTLMTYIRDVSGRCDRFIDHVPGSNTSSGYVSYGTCMKGSGRWTGLDCSGHIFLTTFNGLVMAEEAASILIASHLRHVAMTNNKDLNLLHEKYDQLRIFRILICIGQCLLMALWTLVTLTTSFYFHTFLEKIVGFLVAILAWRILYANLYLMTDNQVGISELAEPLQHLASDFSVEQRHLTEKRPRGGNLFWVASFISYLAASFILV